MAASYDLELLVKSNREDGFGVTRRLNEQIRQKLILLIMTIPGERVMDGNFGVGLGQYLFYSESEWSSGLTSELSAKITEQVDSYMGYIQVESIDIFIQGEQHTLGLRLVYSVPELYDDPGNETVVLEFRARDGQMIDVGYDDYIESEGLYETGDTVGVSYSSGRLGDYFIGRD